MAIHGRAPPGLELSASWASGAPGAQRLGIRVPVLHEDDLAAIHERAGPGDLLVALGVELTRLSPEQRDAVRLRVVEERSYAEVALVLGVSEQAVRARVSRGLRALAGALEPYRTEELSQ